MPMEHIAVQDHEGRQLTDEQVEELFTPYLKSNPKLISFDRAKAEGIYNNVAMYKEEFRMESIDFYGLYFLYGWNLNFEESKFHEFMEDHHRNCFFHAVKLQWLVDCIKTQGLYSVPQAILKENKHHWFAHPGQFRVHAIEYTDSNEDFVLWDIGDKIDLPKLTFEEWWKLYSHHTARSIFFAKFEDKLEVHVGEERIELYGQVKDTIECFGGKKATLEGTCDPILEDLFGKEESNIKIVGHVGIEDCRHFLDFMPNKKIIEKENFTLYNNYHK